jgi:hypothetical protein
MKDAVVSYGTSMFGPPLITSRTYRGPIYAPYPAHGCNAHPKPLHGKVLLVSRGSCSFARKAVLAQSAGAVGMLVANIELPQTRNLEDAWSYIDEASGDYTLFTLADDGTFGVKVRIPVLLILPEDAIKLYRSRNDTDVEIGLSLPVFYS